MHFIQNAFKSNTIFKQDMVHITINDESRKMILFKICNFRRKIKLQFSINYNSKIDASYFVSDFCIIITFPVQVLQNEIIAHRLKSLYNI